MRILFDQATPVPLREFLPDHVVRTAAQEGWERLRNGELLEAAEAAGFDLLLTTDRNLRYQQNLAKRKIAIVVLSKQQWPQLRPHANLIASALASLTAGSFVELSIPESTND